MTVPAPEEYLGHLLRRVQQVHVAAWNRDVSQTITSVQFAALSVVARHPGASQSELGTALDLDRSTIADLVRRMVDRGLLARTRSTADARRSVLDLTDHGSRTLHELRPRVADLTPVLTHGLTADESHQLSALLVRVLAGAAAQGLLSGGGRHER